MTPTPMTIQIAEDILTDLQARLARVRWPDEIAGADWQYGTDLMYLRSLVAYWRQQYDWRLQEAQLNTFRHFTVPVVRTHRAFHSPTGPGASPPPAAPVAWVAGVDLGIP
jgi:epoxide hydrolase